MQRVIIRSIAIVVLMAGTLAGSAAILSPFLVPVRTEITNQLTTLTNDAGGGTVNSGDVRLLTQARNLIDKRSRRATLTSDVQTLANVSALLARTENAAAFDPVLSEAVLNYYDVVTNMALTTETNLNALPASPQVDSALRTLALVNDSLASMSTVDGAYTAARILARAAVRLSALQSFSNRVSQSPNAGPQQLRAFVGSETFQTGPTTSATYNPAFGLLTISGTQVVGSGSRTLSITLSDVQVGTTTHLLGSAASGTYAIYTRRDTNVVGFTSSSGNAIVTLDATGRTVTGSFSFIGVNQFGLDAPISVSGGTFNARIR